MDKILEILNKIKPGMNFESEKGLVSGHILDSIDMTTLISELEMQFDVEIGMEYMDHDNFDSAEDIWKMICLIKEE